MRNQSYTPAAIIALNLDRVELDQGVLAARLGTSVNIQPFLGYYKGKEEHSYLLTLDDERTLEDVLELAKEYEQESVLFLDNQRNVFLCFCEGQEREYLGTFRKVAESHAKLLGDYTYNPVTDSYFAATRKPASGAVL